MLLVLFLEHFGLALFVPAPYIHVIENETLVKNMNVLSEDVPVDKQPEVLKKLAETITELAQKHNLSIVMFASQATGETRPDADGDNADVQCAVGAIQNVTPGFCELMANQIASQSEPMGKAMLLALLKYFTAGALKGSGLVKENPKDASAVKTVH